MKDIFNAIFNRAWALLLLLGIALLLIGIADEIALGSFTIKIPATYGRIALDTVGLLLVGFGLYLGWKESFGSGAGTVDEPKRGVLITPENGVKNVIGYLSDHPDASILVVWGFSLNWTKNISAHLIESPHKNLDVRVFVPNPKIIGKYFNIEDVDQHKSVLKLRLSEWNKLVNQGCVKSITIFSHNLIPNDLGMLVDDKLVIAGTYDWQQEDKIERKNRTEQRISTLSHKRSAQNRRMYINFTDNTEVGKFIIKIYTNRFLCRQFDQIEKAR